MSKRPISRQASHDRWLVSYADFITLLFGLFVVLFAFARSDQKKQMAVTGAIDSAFRTMGVFADARKQTPSGARSATGNGMSLPPANAAMSAVVLSPARVRDDLDRIRRELEKKLSDQVARNTVSIAMGRDGLVISLREAGFFASGSALPKPETLTTLRQVAASLGRTPYDLRIEGHTDNIPIHTAEFDSNWELSSARATRIARLFLDLNAIPADRLSAAGYAEFHPAASNASEAGRAENRRVDLMVLPRTSIDLSVQGVPRAGGAWRRITDAN
jgi:chemotaxis protein MotB